MEADEPLPVNPEFQAAFEQVVAARDGNWRGFVFPRGAKLPEVIDYPVQAQACQFLNLNVEKTRFTEPIDFNGSLFRDTTTFRGTVFQSVVDFAQCRFLGQTDFLNVRCLESASFHRAVFSEQTILRIHFARSANLNEVVFRAAVVISGWRNVNAELRGGFLSLSAGLVGTATIQESPTWRNRIKSILRSALEPVRRALHWAGQTISYMVAKLAAWLLAIRHRYSQSDARSDNFDVFGGEGQLQNVLFGKPEHTSFTQVNLANVYLRGTNLRGVQFLGVNWWQPELARNGLHDERFILGSTDGAFRHRELPVLEETCRNVRVAFEESRSFNIASDFYVAEMEASRARLPWIRRHVFSVQSAYRFVSHYGTSVATALRVLLYLYALHISVTTLLTGLPPKSPAWQTLLESALRSLQLLVFQVPASASGSTGSQWCDALFRIAGLVQVTMIVLAFRTRIKRH